MTPIEVGGLWALEEGLGGESELGEFRLQMWAFTFLRGDSSVGTTLHKGGYMDQWDWSRSGFGDCM